MMTTNPEWQDNKNETLITPPQPRGIKSSTNREIIVDNNPNTNGLFLFDVFQFCDARQTQ